MKILRIDRVALLMGLLLLMNACQLKDSAISIAVSSLPQNTALVMSLNFESLKSKVPEGSFSTLPSVAKTKLDTDSELLLMLFNDSLKTGIDEQELLLFSTSDAQWGAACLLRDEVAFENLIEQVLYEADLPVQIAVAEAYKSCAVDSLVLVWNDEKALMMSACDLSTLLAYFTQDASESLAANADFKAFYAERKELSFWMSMESQNDFMTMLPQFKHTMPAMADFEEMYEGIFASYYVEFLQGEVLLTGKMTPEHKAREVIAHFYHDKPSEKLLAAVPGETYLLMTGAVNMPELLEIYKKIPQFEALFADPKNEEIINTMMGDVVFSISGFASGPMPIPNAVIGLTVQDEALLQAILAIDGVQQVEREGYTALVIQMFQVFVAQNDDMVLISTDEEVIKAFASGEKLEHNLLQSPHGKALSSAGYYYMNLNLEDYPAALSALLQGKVGSRFSQVSSAMCLDEVYAFYDTKTCESQMHIQLTDKHKNSLTALVVMATAIMSLGE